jgi:8-oxo-dGTP pyrophosphatase MutT (NUDIX family)
VCAKIGDAAQQRGVLAGRLGGFTRIATPRPELKASAVALCVVLTADGLPALLITRRTRGLRAHAGQWALPGGRCDPGESAERTALRELDEETGVNLPRSAVLRVLDDYVSRSGYVMTPVVVWGGQLAEAFTVSEAEVAGVHVIALADFDVEPRMRMIPESNAPVISLPLLGRWLHAPTAAIVHQFCQLALHGVTVRVAHLEQPVFAWR